LSDVQINDKVWRKLVAKIGKEMATKGVRVGVLAEKGGNEDRDGITMIELAAIHEFGSPAAGIPQRSFIKSAFEDATAIHAQKIMMGKSIKAVIEDRLTPDQALDLLGLWGVSRIKKGIKKGIEPANADSTVAKKGSSKPLVDTGRLLNAIAHKVES
jgi:hypothetical protein